MDQQAVLQLIAELEQQIKLLVQRNASLQTKVMHLEHELAEKKVREDMFGNLETNERLAMKAKVEQLLRKIDVQLQKTEPN